MSERNSAYGLALSSFTGAAEPGRRKVRALAQAEELRRARRWWRILILQMLSIDEKLRFALNSTPWTYRSKRLLRGLVMRRGARVHPPAGTPARADGGGGGSSGESDLEWSTVRRQASRIDSAEDREVTGRFDGAGRCGAVRSGTGPG